MSRLRPTTMTTLPAATVPKPIAPNGTGDDEPVRGSEADSASTFTTDVGGAEVAAADVPWTASTVVGVAFTTVAGVVVAVGRLWHVIVVSSVGDVPHCGLSTVTTT